MLKTSGTYGAMATTNFSLQIYLLATRELLQMANTGHSLHPGLASSLSQSPSWSELSMIGSVVGIPG